MKRCALIVGLVGALSVAGCAAPASDPVDDYREALELLRMEQDRGDRMAERLHEIPRSEFPAMEQRMKEQGARIGRAMKLLEAAEAKFDASLTAD